jgi:hypothetical protein
MFLLQNIRALGQAFFGPIVQPVMDEAFLISDPLNY